MDLTGEEHIAASRQAVWDTLNDIDALKECIPGCEDIAWDGENRVRAAIKVSLGIISIRFFGILELSDMKPPQSYRLTGRGEGSVAGFAEGVTDVFLTEDGDQTILTYIIRGDAGGKIAQFGTKLLGKAARKVADKFFANIAIAASQRETVLAQNP